jgi:hypothetical protein
MQIKELVLGLLLGLVSMFFITSVISDRQDNLAKEFYSSSIKAQEEIVIEVAKTLGRGAATSRIEKVVPECPLDEMVSYDTLLASLDNGLSRPELVELDRLFNSCGDTAANRRLGAALQLSYEVALLRSYIDGAALIGEVRVEDTNIAKWEELVKKEEQISELFSSLVRSQDAIITTLLQGVSPTSINVENIRASAQKLREELNILVGEAGVLRSELTK